MSCQLTQLSRRRWQMLLFTGSLLLCLWLGEALPFAALVAQPPPASQLVQQGVNQYQQGDYRSAIASWQQALTAYQQSPPQQVIVLENLARAYQKLGDYTQSLTYWQQVTPLYQQLGELDLLGRSLSEQAQIHLQQGQSRAAIALLCGEAILEDKIACQPTSAISIARQQQDTQGETAALGSLAEAYRLSGNYASAIDTLKQAQAMGEISYQGSLLNSLGNTYLNQAQLWTRRVKSASIRGATNKAKEFQTTATENFQQAQQSYQKSLDFFQAKKDTSGQLQASLNLIQLEQQKPEAKLDNNLIEQALSLLDSLPNSSQKVYAAIALANLPASSLTQCLSSKSLADVESEKLLTQAVTIAQTLQNSRVESFALGALGHFYECNQDYLQALKLTQKALWSADQNLIANDSLYLWEWQMGRIYQAQDNKAEAVAAYDRAYSTLEKIRSNILLANRDLQLDFRDVIEPLYRQLAQLKLDLASIASSNTKVENSQEVVNATEAIQIFDSLKLAELQNYLGKDCPIFAVDNQVDDVTFPSQLQQMGAETAVLISMIMEDRTAIILVLPNGQQKLHWIAINKDELTQEIQSFWRTVQEFYDPSEAFLNPAQNLFDYLIRPFLSDLELAHVKTLVFVQDGILRNIPMSALHDGQQFLIENYAVSIVPSISFIASQKSSSRNLQALALGLTEQATIDGETYPALNNVSKEIDAVKTLLPASKPLLNNQFTRVGLQQELNQNAYSILHIATHAQFGTIPEDTFLVTGNNQKITITNLENDIRRFNRSDRPVELLTLTACQTAIGDDRTTLGLAGITLQAGVRSALASLWFISDVYTEELISLFYSSWKTGITKAQALQETQKIAIEKNYHPARWAPFILIGNWQ